MVAPKVSANMPLPACVLIKLNDLHAYVRPFDIILRTPSIPNWLNIIIPGQAEMLEQMGYPPSTIEAVKRYTHCGLVISNSPPYGVLAESTLPEVVFSDLQQFGDKEILVLRYSGDLGIYQQLKGSAFAHDAIGSHYDLLQYLTYPFYMVLGWCPRWIKRLLDSKRKPVCSTFVLQIFHAMGVGLRYKDLLPITPGRLALMDDLFTPVLHAKILG